jgi:hypothetical protein
MNGSASPQLGNHMIFGGWSIEYKMAIFCIWIFPFVVLGAIARDWCLWCRKLFFSVSSVCLFALSFFLLMIINTSWSSFIGMNMAWPEILSRAFSNMFFFFPGLAPVIITTAVGSILKPELPIALVFVLLTGFFHLLYFAGVVFLIGQVPP